MSRTTPFTPGAKASGKISIRNYDHLTMTIWIETIEPERFFSFRWHAKAFSMNSSGWAGQAENIGSSSVKKRRSEIPG